tara:strand:+ start:4681 stop:5271 length:591 start_codon:yes stop_codon:yes gene_type:complete
VATESLIQDFQGNLIDTSNAAEQEIFIHNYIPNYGLLNPVDGTIIGSGGTAITTLRDGLFFNIVSYTSETIVESTVRVYESIEDEEPIVDSYEFLYFAEGDGSIMSIQLSQNEKEIISYRKPVMFQFSLNEQVEIAQRSYVNSIQAREMDFDIVSSLGSITTEDVAIESTTVGEATSLTSTTETITDVGGITTGGY